MNRKNLVTLFLAFVLLDFIALNVLVISEFGLVGAFEAAFANTATTLVAVDLLIALGAVCFWMWNDAKKRGETALPFILLTAATGSAGPLAYLIKLSTGRHNTNGVRRGHTPLREDDPSAA